MIPVAADVWRITTPLPFRPREVHAYLVKSGERRFFLVDGGVDTADAWAALDTGVREIAGGWAAVAAHVVTHMHIDHLGLAWRVRERCGARLLMGRLDAERAAHADANPEEEAAYRGALLRESGAPPALLPPVKTRGRPTPPLSRYVPVDLPLDGEADDLPDIAGWRWIWTPGHTAGHVSLFRLADRVLIGGDAVLPRITPTIGVNRQRTDPVGDYLQTLDRLEAVKPVRVLPGHGEPLEEPAARLRELREATLNESDLVLGCLSEAPLSAWEVTRCRHIRSDLPPSVQMLALRETLAHLRHLVGAARVEMLEMNDGVPGFRAKGGSAG
ncbi:MBL fold metallo-hydrolase [soil metagenome]|nr:MBL fold metallo-hydrolase [Gemmatimonadota bacterium]